MSGHDLEENESMIEPTTAKSRALFEQASEHLDPAIGNRLRLMRRDALAGARARTPYRWLPLGAAAATLLALGLTWWLPRPGAPVLPAATTANSVDADLLPEDDTEIYAWLGEAPVATNDDKANAQ
jgi:hypothetical protein